jgi:hypothetical protein
MYELFPDIHSITPQVGSVKGGTMVTITGTGFKVSEIDEVAVDIDGIPCRVLSASSEEITCFTGAPPTNSPSIADQNMTYPDTENGYRFRGCRGVNYYHYSGISGASLSDLYRDSKYPNRPDYLSVLPSYSTIPTELRKGNNYGARFTAFFNPHASGNHTFLTTNDDEAGVWLAQRNNISEADR